MPTSVLPGRCSQKREVGEAREAWSTERFQGPEAGLGLLGSESGLWVLLCPTGTFVGEAVNHTCVPSKPSPDSSIDKPERERQAFEVIVSETL